MHKFIQLSIFQKAKQLPQRHVAVAAFRGESHLLSVLYFTFGLCIALYIYFVGVSILNLIANREAIAESERLQSDVAALEQEYFDLAKNITPAAAATYGLVAPADTSFARVRTSFAWNSTEDGI